MKPRSSPLSPQTPLAPTLPSRAARQSPLAGRLLVCGFCFSSDPHRFSSTADELVLLSPRLAPSIRSFILTGAVLSVQQWGRGSPRAHWKPAALIPPPRSTVGESGSPRRSARSSGGGPQRAPGRKTFLLDEEGRAGRGQGGAWGWKNVLDHEEAQVGKGPFGNRKSSMKRKRAEWFEKAGRVPRGFPAP